jgi:predicted transcriptional regulator
LKVDEYIYAIPTQKAIDKLADFVDKIIEPPLCIEYFRKNVQNVQLSDSFVSLLKLMKEEHYNVMPVYDGKKFLGVVTEHGILQWLAGQMLDEQFLDLEKIRVEHLPISTSHRDFVFVSVSINMYEADEIFTMRKKKGKGLGAMFITEKGTSTETIIGMIAGDDVALIDDFVI